MATAQLPVEQRFVLRSTDWHTYVGFLDALGDRPVRLTYDRGKMELMTLSLGHERYSRLLGRLVETLTEELGIPIQNAGSTTFNREDLDRGLEADQCFYIEHEAQMRDRDDIDLSQDPPPDLAIEVDISRSSMNRMGIYAALGVPEVWRFDGDNLMAYWLTEAGQFEKHDESRHFPFVALEQLTRFLMMRSEMDDNSVARLFRSWVHEQIAAGWKP